jgi:hypothetical protein
VSKKIYSSGMKKYKVKVGDKIQDRVWYNKKTNQLGVGVPDTWLGDIWFFAEYEENQTIDSSFTNFLDDPRDENSFSFRDMVDLGPL